MQTKTVLVTGASSGIGLATAVSAAEAGWHVIATMRDTAKAGALREAATAAGVTVDVLSLDVTDPGSIDACLTDLPRLDAVVNNAGAGHLGTLELDSIDAVRAVMEVNFFGVLAVTKAAMPLLRASKGRVITITSVGGVVGQPFNEAYCAAKFAAEGFMESFAPLAAKVGVSVCVVEPGAVSSEFVHNVGGRDALQADAGDYADALNAYLARTGPVFASAQTPAGAAEVIVGVLDAEAPAFRVQTSEIAQGFVAAKLKDVDGSTVQGVTCTWVA